MIASPVPDMQGGREQSVWFRFQQLKCAGKDFAPPCALHGNPQYYDTYWWALRGADKLHRAAASTAAAPWSAACTGHGRRDGFGFHSRPPCKTSS